MDLPVLEKKIIDVQLEYAITKYRLIPNVLHNLEIFGDMLCILSFYLIDRRLIHTFLAA